jgi:hypothetical protein
MAHELQHVLAEPFIAAPTSPSKWEYRWVDGLVRSLVGEGVANHCSPPIGFTKEIYEDRTVVASLVKRFNIGMGELSRGQMTVEQAQAWYRSNYFEIAEGLLRDHLEESYSGEELDRKFAEHMQVRPDLEHALGWWMTSRVSEQGRRRKITVNLLRQPYSLFQLYNEALTEEQEDLRIDSAVLDYLDTVREALDSGREGAD